MWAGLISLRFGLVGGGQVYVYRRCVQDTGSHRTATLVTLF